MHKLAIVVAMLASCSKHGAPTVAAGSGCDAIPRAHFQALVKPPLTEVSGAPVGACNAYIAKGQAGFAFAALIYTDGAPHPFEPTAPGAHAVSGVGDHAYWVAVNEPPRFEAIKGKIQCEISAPSADMSSLASTSDADLQAYAQHMGTLCNDMFAAQ
jgi:hypothetical protein